MAKTAARSAHSARGRRVALMAGLRTPFVKAATLFSGSSALELAAANVAELLARLGLDPGRVQRLVFGQVVASPALPNIAREVALACDLPRTVDAYSVARACATGTQAIVDGSMAIARGEIDTAVCGGVDFLSRPPITYSDRVVDALMRANAAKDGLSKLRAFAGLRPKDLLPKPPALREVSTGLTMGESAEVMARDNQISRVAQDALACRSHQRAAAAWSAGHFAAEVMPIRVAGAAQPLIERDSMVRADTSEAKLARLRPVFDRKYGSVTAGNSSPLTDGSAAVVLMAEETAQALGLEPLAYVAGWGFASVDPAWQLLMAPGIAIPRALADAQLSLGDMDLVDMHEAFAAQVLSNLQALASASWQASHAGGSAALGEVPEERLNVHGGSIALGHPFAATGARQATTMARALARRGSGRALISQCAAGGLGAALVLER